MTAWQVLTANSTAPNGSTAWAHLQAQEGGGGGGDVIINPIAQLNSQLSSGSLTASSADGSLTLTPTGAVLTIQPTSPTLSMDIQHGSINHSG